MKKSQSTLLLHRERLALSIRFRLRPGQTFGEKPRQLYIRLTVDGTTCSDYTSGVYVRPDRWQSDNQKMAGNSKLAQETNRELDNIIAEHKKLLAELLRLHHAGLIPQTPTAALVKEHYTSKTTLVPTVLEAYDTYLTYLRSLDGTPDAREKRTLDKWENGKTYLSDYLGKVAAKRLTVDLLTPVWAQGFYHYLVKRPLGLATAARFVGYLRASINHLVTLQRIGNNPIATYFPNKGKDKEIYFLEQKHLDRLWTLKSPTSTHQQVKDWLLLMCYTGMDQPDLERYIANPTQFILKTEAGSMIEISRGKTRLIATIPLLPEVGQILAKYPDGLPRFTNQTLNRWAHVIEEQIDFEYSLTTKICRKSAGALFLLKGHKPEIVSKVLGHASMQTTLRNYVKVTRAMVQADMKRLQDATCAQPAFPTNYLPCDPSQN